MDHNLNIKTVHICRTCMDEITNTLFFNLDFTLVDSEPTIGQKLSNCIPELDLSIIPNTVICGKCADTINSLYIFKKECLQLEMQIREYIQQVQHTGIAMDLAAVMQFHQLHSKSLTAELKTEAFEKTENYKNEESPTSFNETEENTEIATGVIEKTENYKNEESTASFCDNYVFNETERYTEVVNREYLTSLAMVERQCVLFNNFANFIESGKLEAENNSDTHDDNNIVQDCILQVVENQNSCSQNLNKTDICYRDNTLYQNKVSPKSHKSLHCWYRCDLCNYSTKYKCLFSFHNRAHLTRKDFRHILKSSPILVKPSTNTIIFGKENNKGSEIKCENHSFNKHQCNISKVKMGTNIIVKPFKCSLSKICDFSSYHKHDLKIHMLTHRVEKPFKCSLCEYKCNHKHHLKRHMLAHTDEKPFKCSICKYSCNYKQNLKSHMLTHTDDKPFKCSVCEYSCNRKDSLKSHMLTHTDEKPHKCSVCEYSCNRKDSLKSHMLTHTDDKPFKCSVCEHRFNKKYNLKMHILTHTGEKPCKCSICEYSCNNKNRLKHHILTHTGEKLFKCSLCEYNCNHKHHLKTHMLTHTGEKPFKCSFCEYICNQKQNLKSHVLTHTGEKPFKCLICEYCSTTKNQLKIHMQIH